MWHQSRPPGCGFAPMLQCSAMTWSHHVTPWWQTWHAATSPRGPSFQSTRRFDRHGRPSGSVPSGASAARRGPSWRIAEASTNQTLQMEVDGMAPSSDDRVQSKNSRGQLSMVPSTVLQFSILRVVFLWCDRLESTGPETLTVWDVERSTRVGPTESERSIVYDVLIPADMISWSSWTWILSG